MSKKLFFIMNIALIAILGFGMTGTGAWFTDQATVENAAVSTGSLDLQITNVGKTSPMLEPGGAYKEVLRFCAKNNGNYDMKWYGKLADLSDPSGMAAKVLVKAVMNPTGFAGNYGPANAERFTDVVATSLTVFNDKILLDSTVAVPFKPGDNICYSIQAKLASDAGNGYQSKVFAANLQLDATQWINTGWAE